MFVNGLWTDKKKPKNRVGYRVAAQQKNMKEIAWPNLWVFC